MDYYPVRICRVVVLLWVLDMVVCLGTRGERWSHLLAQAATPSNVAAVSPGKTSPESLPGVLLHDQRLSIDVRDQDLHAILKAIASQGSIDVRRLEEVPNKRLSLRFTDVPLLTALQRLLRAAEVNSYVLVTEPQAEGVRVQRMLFLAVGDQRGTTPRRPLIARRPPLPASPQPPSRDAVAPPQDNEQTTESNTEQREGASVFDELRTNTAARRLLSQLVHPNEQVRERALERLVRLVGEDEKQAELMEFLDPLLEGLASEDQTEREEARQEIRKLLQR